VDFELTEKIERLKKMLAAENLGGILINSQHNFAWLTGGKSNGINLSVENGACYLLIRGDGKSFLLANNIEMPRISAEEISAEDFEPVEFSWQQEKSSGDYVIKKAQSLLNENKTLASDLFLNDQIRPIENLIARCRYELTGAEIERYKNLGKDAGKAVGELCKRLQTGESEIEIARKVKNALAVDNINSVVTLVGADERIGRFRHPIPTENIWKKVLLIAVCAKREGLIVNLSRIVCAGEIPVELQRRTEATAYVFAKLAVETVKGKTGADLYKIAADAYAEKGFAYEINLHHQGGATGYKTRDWVAHPTNGEKVCANQAFAWNPSVTGTKTEDTFLSSANDFEIITPSTNFPQIETEINGHKINTAGILSL
jgi:Xaa-Pro dipeptidase